MSMRAGTIVTLNYDNCLEHAAKMGAYFPIDAGPYPMSRDARVRGFANSADAVRVIKLHGSFNWGTDPINGVITILSESDLGTRHLAQQLVPTRPPVPGIIFGAGNKLRPHGPYLGLYLEFAQALNRARRLIVIGYGWGDAHVNELLRRWLQRHDVARLFRVGRRQGIPLPWEQRRWYEGNDSIQVQVISGAAAKTIVELMRPAPGLLR